MPSSILLASLLALGGAGQARFDDVIRHLRNPEPRARLNAVKVLREARHPEAIVPMAALVNDPLDPIQLEAIAAELSFFLIEAEPDLLPGLKDPAPAIRAAVADVLGEIGGDASLAALRDIQDRNKDVVEAATRGMERIRLRRSP